MSRFAIFFASGFGSGFLPVAPGTWGSLAGTVILGILWSLGWVDQWVLILVTILTTYIGYLSIKKLPPDWIHDDGRIVIDEVIGVFVTMIFIPISWTMLLSGFVLFRVYDIWKPLGIRKMDRLNSDFSVLADDILAGVYANLTLQLVVLLLSLHDNT